MNRSFGKSVSNRNWPEERSFGQSNDLALITAIPASITPVEVAIFHLSKQD